MDNQVGADSQNSDGKLISSFYERTADYSIFNPSLFQYKLISETAKKAGKFMNREPDVIRTLIVRSLVKFQQKYQIYLYEIETDLPQIRVALVYRQKEYVLQELDQFIDDNTKKTELRNCTEEWFQRYIEKCAFR